MQELQPEIQKLRKQYGSDKQGFSQAMMALQKERGVNPLAGCLPILPQIPVFIALFHVLRRLAPGAEGLYSWSDELTDQAAHAPSSSVRRSPRSFNMTGAQGRARSSAIPASYTDIRIVCVVLIVIMCCTTFFTQKQIMKRSGPVEGQAAMVQKLLLYGMPISLFVSGFFFPVGVLLYWFTNNLWTLGQQFYILRKLPPPGSPAALAKAAADKPAVDPKTLAPKPGAKPVRPKPGRPAAVPGRRPSTPTARSATCRPPATPRRRDRGRPRTTGARGGRRQRPSGAAATGRRRGGTGSRSAAARAGPANRGKRKRR